MNCTRCGKFMSVTTDISKYNYIRNWLCRCGNTREDIEEMSPLVAIWSREAFALIRSKQCLIT